MLLSGTNDVALGEVFEVDSELSGYKYRSLSFRVGTVVQVEAAFFPWVDLGIEYSHEQYPILCVYNILKCITKFSFSVSSPAACIDMPFFLVVCESGLP